MLGVSVSLYGIVYTTTINLTCALKYSLSDTDVSFYALYFIWALEKRRRRSKKRRRRRRSSKKRKRTRRRRSKRRENSH